MRKLRFASIVLAAALACGCGLFKKYSDSVKAPDNLFGAATEVVDSASVADLGWRQFFTDPVLRAHIDTALARNNDLTAARLRVQEAGLALKASKLAFLPSLGFNPSFTITPGMSYSVPVGASWGTPGFGTLTNAKREAQVLALKAEDEAQTVQSQLIAQLASAYCQLQMLDRQLEIIDNTEKIWAEVLETQKGLMENGKSYSTSVDQMQAALLGVKIQREDLQCEMENTENIICLLMAKTPKHVERSAWGEYTLPADFRTGIPAALLGRRPDVRSAERSVEAAYYVNRQALAAMCPGLTLAGSIGWTSLGMAISDPGRLLYEAVASLSQPIFAQGKLRARLKITELQQKEAAEMYTKAVLGAGAEVNKALRECQESVRKDVLHKQQVSALQSACDGTRELMLNGKANYIEVLTAQNTLLEGLQSETANLYEGYLRLISLYIALGGGCR